MIFIRAKFKAFIALQKEFTIANTFLTVPSQCEIEDEIGPNKGVKSVV